MITKIFSFIIILFVWYGLLVFLSPDTSSRIDWFLWVSWFTETLRGKKEKVDTLATDWVNNLYRFWDDARWFMDGAKERIDDVRETTNKIEELTWEFRTGVESMRDLYDNTTQSFEDISWTLRQINPNTNTLIEDSN